ncbi:MAG: HD domain-containing protein [Fibrobacteria bacterium]|nr:HD domain-containing protein [Fibrobacteria bacterium]
MKKTNSKVLSQTSDFVQNKLKGEGSGHDWWHVYRVWTLAIKLAEKEGADLFIVELAALLHDIADWKFHNGDETVGPRLAAEWLGKLDVESKTINRVCDIINTLSFKGSGVPTPMSTIEGEIVQDADRLDAMGAIGIARAFAYGGNKNREMHNPDIPPVQHHTFEEYKKNQSTTINHFHEKLLLLKGQLNTSTAKNIGKERHKFMNVFLEQFHREWDDV